MKTSLLFSLLAVLLLNRCSLSGNEMMASVSILSARSEMLIEKVVETRIAQVDAFHSKKDNPDTEKILKIDKKKWVQYYKCEADWLFDVLTAGDTVFIMEKMFLPDQLYSWYFTTTQTTFYINSTEVMPGLDCGGASVRPSPLTHNDSLYIQNVRENRHHFMKAKYSLNNRKEYYFTSMIYIHESSLHINSIISSDRLRWDEISSE